MIYIMYIEYVFFFFFFFFLKRCMYSVNLWRMSQSLFEFKEIIVRLIYHLDHVYNMET